MNDKDKSLSPVRQSYREAWRAICNRYAVLKAMAPAQKVAPAAGHRDEANFGAKSVPSVAPAAGQSDGQERETDQSYAQVASAVGQQAVRRQTCGLKPGESRPCKISTRFASDERDFLVRQAETSCLTLSEYIRASALGPGYAATIDPMKRQLLKDVLQELNRQGNNLNQIARQLNAGDMEPNQGERELSRLEQSLIAAQRAVRTALAEGKVY